MIRTWIVGVESNHADHLTITTAIYFGAHSIEQNCALLTDVYLGYNKVLLNWSQMICGQ